MNIEKEFLAEECGVDYDSYTSETYPMSELITEKRPCKDCRHSKKLPNVLHLAWICKKKLMQITSDMHVSYDADDGTCFEEMRVLSVRAPWGYWIFGESLPDGVTIKDIENRTRLTNYCGKVLIQIPSTVDIWAYEWLSETFGISNFCTDNNFKPGNIIGSVDLIDCVQDHSSKWAMPECWHWILENPVMFDTPIPCKGQLGLFKVPENFNKYNNIMKAKTIEEFKAEMIISFSVFGFDDDKCKSMVANTLKLRNDLIEYGKTHKLSDQENMFVDYPLGKFFGKVERRINESA